jgi:hypothetical protein
MSLKQKRMPSSKYIIEGVKEVVDKALHEAELTKQLHSHDITCPAHREASKVAELCYKILRCYNPAVLPDY